MRCNSCCAHLIIYLTDSLNNANYVRMAMELLPEEFVISGLRVEYRVAAKFGDSLVPTVYKNGKTIIISLSIGEDVAAIIEFC